MHNPAMAQELTTSYLKEVTDNFRRYKRLAEQAMQQVPDEALTVSIDPESNSIATIVKHLSGNMHSRWTDFLTTDGEKPNRNRDGEFESPPQSRAEITAAWESGWKLLFAALASLTEDDLDRTVTIRTEPHSVLQAISRHIAHCTYHIGQIVFLAKHLTHDRWKTLSVPRGKSADYNARVASGQASRF